MSNLEWFQVAGVLIIFVCLLIAWLSERKRANAWQEECVVRDRVISRKNGEWHVLNEEMRVTLEERNHFQQQVYAALDRITSQRATIHLLRLRCQEARNSLRGFCSRPSQMMDVIDKLEKDFRVERKSN